MRVLAGARARRRQKDKSEVSHPSMTKSFLFAGSS
jgi:hypothetical protein